MSLISWIEHLGIMEGEFESLLLKLQYCMYMSCILDRSYASLEGLDMCTEQILDIGELEEALSEYTPSWIEILDLGALCKCLRECEYTISCLASREVSLESEVSVGEDAGISPEESYESYEFLFFYSFQYEKMEISL